MKLTPNPLLLVLLLVTACQSAPRPAAGADPETRNRLWSMMQGLAGRWQTQDADGKSMYVEVQATAGGTAMREIMFPGTNHEMTNMYHLDGGSLLMTHYCAGGNQPRMRATLGAANQLRFQADSVTDLKSSDAVYMGEMLLVLEDANHIRQEWKALRNGSVDHETVFKLTRVR